MGGTVCGFGSLKIQNGNPIKRISALLQSANAKCQTPLQNNHSGVFLRASVLASLGRLPWLARVQCVGQALMPDKFWLFICIQHN